MKKAGGATFTGTYIMYGLLAVALIILVVFIVRNSLMERFFATNTADPIQAKFDNIDTESNKIRAIPSPETQCNVTKELLNSTREDIIKYDADRKTKFNEYARTFNNYVGTVRANCNRGVSITVENITPIPDTV